MNELNQSESKWQLSEALLMAFLTGSAYWIALRYEAAYLGFFGFPPHSAEISLASVAVSFFLMWGALFVLFTLANVILLWLPQHPAFRSKFARVALLLVVLFWQLLWRGIQRQVWPFYCVAFGWLLVFEFLWPILVFRDKPAWRERFIADEEAENRTRARTLLGRIQTSLGLGAFNLIFVVILATTMADTAGESTAQRTKKFLVSVSELNLLVVRLYQDRALCVRVDTDGRRIRNLVFLPLSEGRPEFEEREIGMLERKEPAKP
jgi:hypothetical protein